MSASETDTPQSGASPSAAASPAAQRDDMDKAPFDVTLSFAAGGWLQMYHFGVCKALCDSGFIDRLEAEGRRVRFVGSSAGSLAAAALASGCPFYDDMAAFALECGEHYRESPLHLLCMRDYLQAAVRRFGQWTMGGRGTEKDDAKAAAVLARLNGGRLEVYATGLPRLQSVCLDRFEDLADVEEALCASCCLSPVVGLPFALRRSGVWVCDGGITAFQPRAADERRRQELLRDLRLKLDRLRREEERLAKLVRRGRAAAMDADLSLAPAAAERLAADIHRLEAAHLHINVSPFYFTSADVRPTAFVPAWWGIYPPDRATHANLFNLGFNDTIDFLVRAGHVDAAIGPKLRRAVLPPPPRGPFAAVYDIIGAVFYVFVLRPVAVAAIYAELLIAVVLAAASWLRQGLLRLLGARSLLELVFGCDGPGWYRRRRGPSDRCDANNSSSGGKKRHHCRRRVRVAAADSASPIDGYDSDFYRDVERHGTARTVTESLRSIASGRQLARLLFNTSLIPFNEVRLAARSRLYRLFAPLVFRGNRPEFEGHRPATPAATTNNAPHHTTTAAGATTAGSGSSSRNGSFGGGQGPKRRFIVDHHMYANGRDNFDLRKELEEREREQDGDDDEENSEGVTVSATKRLVVAGNTQNHQ